MRHPFEAEMYMKEKIIETVRRAQAQALVRQLPPEKRRLSVRVPLLRLKIDITIVPLR